MKKLKDNKAVGGDEIPNEAWKYGGERMEEWIREMCNRVWRGEEWPEEWKEGIVVPIVKKGEGRVVGEYRGVTLMNTLYKIYASVLAGRLRKEVEEKGLIPQNQTGFRKGLGVIDNIYVMNYVINRQLGRKGGKLVALFVDLKAAFDTVDRRELIRAMRERRVRKGLVERCEEVMEETISRKDGGQEKHIKERIKIGMTVMGQVWGIGKRRFEREWGKRIWLYDSLVWTVIGSFNAQDQRSLAECSVQYYMSMVCTRLDKLLWENSD
ncbi:uncharacterized protein LOC112590540 [Harpegnathos saltator]|uniref:uncharacterized protein LOC112590540 n=1 Tax=Harpegnathos saltator TaxID=610380 RepID=UPI000DBED2CF|nr:uncharacterized protein LOC112590540 [Harpegnathos saltator]